MEQMKKKIVESGRVISEGILKVDSFLNHQIDVELIDAAGKYIADFFADYGVTKVLTVESSGIAPAFAAAKALGVDMIFARKNQSVTLKKDDGELLTAEIYSFTKQVTSEVYISKKYISDDDVILIIDDFLANGEVAKGIIEMIGKTNAKIAGFGIVIEKSFQKGRTIIEEYGYPVCSLARIKSLKENKVEFVE